MRSPPEYDVGMQERGKLADMSIGMMLSNLILGPLKLLFEVIFALSNQVLSEAASIVVLSLVVNVLVLPLYRRADAIQAQTREKEATLAPSIRHIKAVFQGDEQFMMLQTFYREQHYSPLYTLRAALPLLLQVPFFIAAYQFLNQLGCLHGAALGPIQDLGQPDRLLRLGGITMNLLPVLMTLINLVSGAIYTKGAPVKEKLQLGGMALIFLVLLYDSPAGLTFYWTLNNLFSLGKNVVQKFIPAQKKEKKHAQAQPGRVPRPRLFVLCCAVLAVLTGLLIPSAVLVSSPHDFINYATAPDPIWYAINAFLLAVGTFVIWFGVYYALAGSAAKKGMEFLAWVLTGIFSVNYLFFRNNLGTISSSLIYDYAPAFTLAQKLVNLGILLLVAGIFIVLLVKKETLVRGIAWTMILTMGGMAVRNLWITEREVSESFQIRSRNYEGAMEIPLSQEGQNVVILMLDRAVSSYLPCILYERPDLKEVFSGFTYYPNAISFGGYTNLGAPAIFGGYEYTPEAMNARDTILLRDKQNEALMLMPTLFSEQGYKISIFDVPYPGDYTTTGDYSIFDSLPNTNARILSGAAEISSQWTRSENLQLRNFFCYSLSMVVPSVLYGRVYNWGNYNHAEGSDWLFSFQGASAETASSDIDYAMMEFVAEYEVLHHLTDMTKVLPDRTDTLLVMANMTSHSQVSLPEPEYAPVRRAENEAYDAEHADRFLAGPLPLIANETHQLQHYQTTMSALLQVAEWLRYLKEAGVYDHTRIILVSDHGAIHLQIPQGIIDTGVDSVGFNAYGSIEDVMTYNPLLMVKDFDAAGEIRTDTTFMTNADVPTIAMKGLISNPVNPFTGNAVGDAEKNNTCHVSFSHVSSVGRDKGTTFEPAYWFAVTPGGDTVFDPSRWTVIPELK